MVFRVILWYSYLILDNSKSVLLQHKAAFHQGLYSLLKQESSGTEIHIFLEMSSDRRFPTIYAQSDQSIGWSFEYSMSVKLLTEHPLEFLSLKKERYTDSSESTLVKTPLCWKSHVVNHQSVWQPFKIQNRKFQLIVSALWNNPSGWEGFILMVDNILLLHIHEPPHAISNNVAFLHG